MNIKMLDSSVNPVSQRETWFLTKHGFKALQMANFYIEGITPVLASLFMEEPKNYSAFVPTRSFSAIDTDETDFYKKWYQIVFEDLSKKMDEKYAEMIAHDIGSYGLSIFSPNLNMLVSLNLNQLESILNKIQSYLDKFKDAEDESAYSTFERGLVSVLEDVYSQMSRFIQGTLVENAQFNLFAPRLRGGEYGETYTHNYKASFRCLLYYQLSNSIKYEIQFPNGNQSFYIPPLFLKNLKRKNEWQSDLVSLKDRYPQATLMDISEKGHLDLLIKKCKANLDGSHEEVKRNLKDFLKRYVQYTSAGHPFIANSLRPYLKKMEQMEIKY